MEKLSVVPAIKKPTLQEVLTRFETWRKGKKPGSRIPKCLWAAAVDVCDVHSLCEVSKALGLNYTELKRRYAIATEKAQRQQPTSTGFIEIPPLAMSSTCVIELSKTSGATMKMTFQGQRSGLDPVAMMRAFWSQRS